MCFGSLDTERAGHNSPLLAWGLFLAIVACVPTGWCIVDRLDKKRSEVDPTISRIIDVVDALEEERKGVRHVH